MKLIALEDYTFADGVRHITKGCVYESNDYIVGEKRQDIFSIKCNDLGKFGWYKVHSFILLEEHRNKLLKKLL